MSDQFGMPLVDHRPSHEVIAELRDQLTATQAREAELMADNARLREALEDGFNKISQMCFEGEWTGIETTIDKIRKTLTATPEQRNRMSRR